MLYNKYRPRRFSDVVGQESEITVLKSILQKNVRPPHVMLCGGFGLGKTTLARIFATSILCQERTDHEPCGKCKDCEEMARETHMAYAELDSASSGNVSEVRELKDSMDYSSPGGRPKVFVFDESHAMSSSGQNALLQTLESGRGNFVVVFCTTEASKMLPTIRSRCVTLHLKSLTVAQIDQRLQHIAKAEGIKFEDRAIRLIATYARGHLRDAVVTLEQISTALGEVTFEGVRIYLRLDRQAEVYGLLDAVNLPEKELYEKVESLLCSFSITELVQLLCTVLINGYRVSLGVVTELDQLDSAWLGKLLTRLPRDYILKTVEALTRLRTDSTTIQHSAVLLTQALRSGEVREVGQTSSELGAKMKDHGVQKLNNTNTPNPSMRKVK